MTPTISLARIQTDPATGFATAFFETTYADDTGTVVARSPWVPVQWSLTATDKTVTVDGITLTDAQISAAVVAIAERVRTQA